MKHDHMNQAPSSEHNFEYHHTFLEPMPIDTSRRAAFPYALGQTINPLGATQSELKRRFYEYNQLSLSAHLAISKFYSRMVAWLRTNRRGSTRTGRCPIRINQEVTGKTRKQGAPEEGDEIV